MALVVLDASVIIGFLDPEDVLHEVSVAALTERQRDDLVAPASVYAEILVAPYRAASRRSPKSNRFFLTSGSGSSRSRRRSPEPRRVCGASGGV